MFHHTAGSHVSWKACELNASLSLSAWMSNPFFFSGVPFLWFSPSQDCCYIKIIGLHSVQPGCQCSFWIEISSLVPRFSSDLPFTAAPSASAHFPPRLRWVIIMTPASQYNGTASMIDYLQWVSWSGALSIDYSPCSVVGDLCILSVRHGTHSKWQPEGAFIPPQNSITFLCVLSACAELFRV